MSVPADFETDIDDLAEKMNMAKQVLTAKHMIQRFEYCIEEIGGPGFCAYDEGMSIFEFRNRTKRKFDYCKSLPPELLRAVLSAPRSIIDRDVETGFKHLVASELGELVIPKGRKKTTRGQKPVINENLIRQLLEELFGNDRDNELTSRLNVHLALEELVEHEKIYSGKVRVPKLSWLEKKFGKKWQDLDLEIKKNKAANKAQQ